MNTSMLTAAELRRIRQRQLGELLIAEPMCPTCGAMSQASQPAVLGDPDGGASPCQDSWHDPVKPAEFQEHLCWMHLQVWPSEEDPMLPGKITCPCGLVGRFKLEARP